MEPTQEQLDLIKSCIVQNANYNKKIHRLGEVANLVYGKAALFLNSISNEKTLRKYVEKTANEVLEKYTVKTSIENIQEQQEIFAEKIAETELAPTIECKSTAEIEQPVELESLPMLEEEPVVVPEHKPAAKLKRKPAKAVNEESVAEIEQLIEPESLPALEEEPVAELEFLLEPELKPMQESSDFSKELELLENISTKIVEEPVEPTVLEDVSDIEIPLIPTSPQENAYSHIEDPIVNVKTKKISKELTEKIIDIVLMAQKEEPEKQYSKIFYSKYVKKMKQSEIAREMSISEEELCNRYLKLVRIVKREIG